MVKTEVKFSSINCLNQCAIVSKVELNYFVSYSNGYKLRVLGCHWTITSKKSENFEHSFVNIQNTQVVQEHLYVRQSQDSEIKYVVTTPPVFSWLRVDFQAEFDSVYHKKGCIQ